MLNMKTMPALIACAFLIAEAALAAGAAAASPAPPVAASYRLAEAAKDAHPSHEAHDHEKKPAADKDHDGHKHEAQPQKETDRKAHDHDKDHAAEKDGHKHDEHAAEKDGHKHEAHGVLRLTAEQVKLAGIDSTAVTPGAIDLTVDLAGEVHLNEDRVVQVVPRIAGVVSSVNSHLGDRVAQGTVMAVMDSRELADAKSSYIAARERARLAKSKFEREERLRSKQISSEQEFLDAKSALAEAEIAERAATQKLIALGFSAAAVKAMSSGADESLTRFEISAPIKGTVIEKRVSVGSSVGENDALFRVAELTALWVMASVYEKDIAKIAKGAAVSIVTKAYPERTFGGRVTWISDILDERTRTLKIRAEVDNHGGLLKPGMFVQARVVTGTKENVLTVPVAAVRRQGGETVVFVDEGNGRYSRREVTIGAQAGDKVEVLNGLKPGERVVSTGSFILKSEIEKESFEAGHAH